MIPPVMYHGTTKTFRRFNLAKAYHDSFLGPALYLTDSYSDALDFYATEQSPDLQCRINHFADNLMYDDCDDWNQAISKAKRELCGKEKDWRILHVKPLVNNVAVMCHAYNPQETRIPLWNTDEDNPDEIVETPQLQTIVDYLGMFIEPEYITFDDSETTLREIRNIINNHYHDYEEITHGELLKHLMIKLGYDAVYMLNVDNFFPMMRGYNANHLIVFNPEQAKIVKRERVI